jgi:hypothetical protein
MPCGSSGARAMSEHESPHIAAVRKQDRLNRLATGRIRVAGGKVEKHKSAPPVRETEEVVADARAADERAYREAIATAMPGDMFEGHGVFLGTWEPRDREKNSLRLKFNVFAAPEDLPQTDTYYNTVEHVSRLKNWHDYDGAGYSNSDSLYAALKRGDYNGEWVIPPLDLLGGRDLNTEARIQDANIFDHRNDGAFKDTFKTTAGIDSGLACYWSSTDNLNTVVWSIDFTDGGFVWHIKDSHRFPCRPVRLEPVS